MWCRGFVFTILIVNAKLNHVYHCELTIIDKLHYSFDGNLVSWSPMLNYWSFVTPCGFNSPWIYEGKAPELESTGRVKSRLEALEEKEREDKLHYAVNYRIDFNLKNKITLWKIIWGECLWITIDQHRFNHVFHGHSPPPRY